MQFLFKGQIQLSWARLREPLYPVFRSLPVEVLIATDKDGVLGEVFKSLMKKYVDYEMGGSGWLLHELLRLNLHTYEYVPLHASTYIPFPTN